MKIEIVEDKNILCKTIHYNNKNKRNKFNIYCCSLFVKFYIAKKYKKFQVDIELVKDILTVLIELFIGGINK